MIDLYTAATPNGRKPAIALEEMGLPYTVHTIDLSQKEQFSPEFVALNPNSKIPVITDRDTGLTIFESGAILIYLAEKTGMLWPSDRAQRMDALQWLMFQMGSVGPMLGQLGHFRHSAPEPVPYGITRYEAETLRLFGVLDRQLSHRDYVAGAYSIADIALYPWIALYNHLQVSIEAYPHLTRWVNTLTARPAVQAGMARVNQKT
ncbi:glutathione S-transferase family protein [Spirulina major]|uniref:glutathione S-transferase family protein n=1 Tax=Spirulina major TaxID=270636 RepID=UPI000934BC24|nr:glutathione S-transferase N-terminal domain-containing protein [Spirulina major]